MARMKHSPKTYQQAIMLLAGRVRVKLGHNTYLDNVDADKDYGFIGVRFHSTYIVRFHPDGRITLWTGGWNSVTTKERINHFITGHVYSERGQMYYVGHTSEGLLDHEHPEYFYEGINIDYPTRVRDRLLGVNERPAEAEPCQDCGRFKCQPHKRGCPQIVYGKPKQSPLVA